ncbi:WYL domain-containing protein [Paenibacillus sp. GSMTC-2017]|uniref:WYL domain-containing protein n=1 Tax=Paenibacillus sp. GSMTC-2017 TaxID=2794350 RepID=UPI0018D9C588|nr:WYL domain-containing protein [Paenibacillus sp. GSMTC-2017]MBH5318557.1 WYL domain-containing protein [Paenibacillus sp. GSMTC-2017]
MNPFEKIFNYQIISRLDDTKTIALTAQERSWVKTMLGHPTATDAFAPETLHKLQNLLQDEATTEINSIITQKAKSNERQIYHPLLRALRRMIMMDKGITLSFHIKNGGLKERQSGLPYKLEYSMVKREWYLLWYNTNTRSLMSTKLQGIVTYEEILLPAKRIPDLKARITRLQEQRKKQAVIEIVPTYNPELSRILYAFSCFEKSVSYNEESKIYHIRVTYLADESDFLLSKIRFLGLRVKVVEGGYLIHRMHESSTKALDRYGIVMD